MEEKSTVEFPTRTAQDAKLLLPKGYDPYQSEDDRRKCFFRFDDQHNALVLVADDDTNEILDILSVDDVIGASVQVELEGSSCSTSIPEPRVAKSATSSDGNAPKSPVLSDTQAFARLMIYAYPRRDPSKESLVTNCAGKQNTKPVKTFQSSDKESTKSLLHRYPHHRSFQVAPAEDMAPIRALVKAIRTLARPTSSSDTTDRLLVLINPFSGTKKGLEIYKSIVAPMLDQAGIDHDHVVTTHAGHAEELMATKVGQVTHNDDGIGDISKYDGLVAIGGDGSVYEIMQGIKKRHDCDALLKILKLGHIGAGTSNGLSSSRHQTLEFEFVR